MANRKDFPHIPPDIPPPRTFQPQPDAPRGTFRGMAISAFVGAAIAATVIKLFGLMSGECPAAAPNECKPLLAAAAPSECKTTPLPADFDGDGVPDSKDKCPNDMQTADLGCPLSDGDNDKIPDRFDECPAVSGEIRGCPAPEPPERQSAVEFEERLRTIVKDCLSRAEEDSASLSVGMLVDTKTTQFLEPPKITISDPYIMYDEYTKLKCIKTGVQEALNDGPPRHLSCRVTLAVQR